MTHVKAVLFDLFETLISEFADGARKVDRANRNDAARLGLTHEVYRKEWGARSVKRSTGAFADYFAAMRDLLGGQNAAVPEQVLRELYEERVLEKKAAFADIRPDVFELLERLKRGGVKLALVSNCTEEEVVSWPDCGLAAYFDEVLFSYEVRLAKPDPSIYKLACERLGVAPGECVFIGDGGSDELNGAKAAGIRAYQAVWQLPPSMRERDSGYPQLVTPLAALDVV
ncbi:HAD family hydrolase [Paenibacillus ginsengarvi]|uniref:HAD family hydrolase n=1 Tax=Paenibacillus ginsengarvi TaxID=400777 RepID=A0A3B0CIU7_9BACL|nr:HAD-IA family hydrolase [Paenibacillus ginsengarvi]RKN84229.1 HAD family hydrolase [Paenibacillus ginsengarvi]